MGVDLTLLPLDCYFPKDETRTVAFGYAHSILGLDRDYALWGRIGRDAQAGLCGGHGRLMDPDASITSYVSREGGEDSHYGGIREDAYGNPIVWVPSSLLAALMLRQHDVDPLSPRNRAVASYLSLIEDTLVGIYWH